MTTSDRELDHDDWNFLLGLYNQYYGNIHKSF